MLWTQPLAAGILMSLAKKESSQGSGSTEFRMAKKQPLSSKRSSRGGETPSRNQLCPCGSGKKYKRCCALKAGGTAQLSKKILMWIGGITVAALLGYGVVQMGGPGNSSVSLSTPSFGGLLGTGYYTEADLGEVDFSVLTEAQKKKVLEDINRAMCTCGCNLNLAQCVATDSTCPLRNSNIERIRSLVRQESG